MDRVPKPVENSRSIIIAISYCVLVVGTGCQSINQNAPLGVSPFVTQRDASPVQTVAKPAVPATQSPGAQAPVFQVPGSPSRATTQGPVASRSNFQAQPNPTRSQATYPYPTTAPPVRFAQAGPVLGFQPQNFTNQPNFPATPVFQQPRTAPPVVGPGGSLVAPGPQVADIDVFIPQGLTGRINAGGTIGSDNGLLGQVVIDERNFGFPRSFREAFGPNAFQGGGQKFRAEITPGDDVERYLISLSNPFFRGSQRSLSVSGYYFDRQFFDWDEQRAGGSVLFGRRLSPFLSVNAEVRLESVTIDNPRVATSAQLNADLGNSNLFIGSLGLVYDTRVNPFLTAQGSYLSINVDQAFGDFTFTRGELEYRHHRLIYQRPDTSGRHTIQYRTKLGFTGSETPVFENFFAGGATTFRGFDFRGVSPIDGDVRVGGEFQWLNTVEYQFPVTQDDLVNAVLFVDFGTIEEDITLSADNFRVSPGFGLRVHLPWAGFSAPLSFDFAFPVATAAGDEERFFSFLIGASR